MLKLGRLMLDNLTSDQVDYALRLCQIGVRLTRGSRLVTAVKYFVQRLRKLWVVGRRPAARDR